MLFYEITQSKPALEACEKIADLIIETFGSGQSSLTHDGQGGQMNMAICHGLVLLYEKTGQEKFLDFAEYIVKVAWNEQGAGKYFGIRLKENQSTNFRGIVGKQSMTGRCWGNCIG